MKSQTAYKTYNSYACRQSLLSLAFCVSKVMAKLWYNRLSKWFCLVYMPCFSHAREAVGSAGQELPQSQVCELIDRSPQVSNHVVLGTSSTPKSESR